MMHALHMFWLFHLVACLGKKTLGSEIIHGKKVPKNLMLYMASVQNTTGHVCGGFLIREDFVMTAAHCDSPKLESVVLGTHDLKKVINSTMRFGIKKCIHPSYKKVDSGNDIMLLKLSRKAPMNDEIQTIRIPKSEIKWKGNRKCRVAGWGFMKTRGKYVDALEVVDVSTVDLKVCKKKWSQEKVTLPVNITCAGGLGTNKGFCQGDSGGPLVCGGEAVGVVSFNSLKKKCDYPNLPNIYTDISKNLQWINTVLKQKNFSKHCRN